MHLFTAVLISLIVITIIYIDINIQNPAPSLPPIPPVPPPTPPYSSLALPSAPPFSNSLAPLLPSFLERPRSPFQTHRSSDWTREKGFKLLTLALSSSLARLFKLLALASLGGSPLEALKACWANIS